MMSDNDKKLTVGIIGTGAGNMRTLAGDVGPAEITDKVTIPPLVTGLHGRAWQCDLEVARRLKNIRAEDDGTLVHWLIEAPWAHPVWHSYSLVLVHLRGPTMPDDPPTVFYLDGATHELWLFAVNPDEDRAPMISTGLVEGRWLQPKNFASQFIELDDDLAMIRISYIVQAICDGVVSPDTDYIHQWIERFGNNMIKPEWR